MTRALHIARLTLGNRPVTLPRDHVSHESGKIAMARALLSLPALVEAWRDEAAKIRACGDAGKAAGMERCAADVEAAIGTTSNTRSP